MMDYLPIIAIVPVTLVSYFLGYKQGYHEATKFAMKQIDELHEFFRKELHRGLHG